MKKISSQNKNIKKFILFFIFFYFIFNIEGNSYTSTNELTLKCKINSSTKKKIKWYNFKDKIYFQFKNNRLLSIDTKVDYSGFPKFDNEIDWTATFKNGAEVDPWDLVIEGIFANSYNYIYSYEIRLDTDNNDGYINIEEIKLKDEAFEDWKIGNNPTFAYFHNWFENYPIKKEKLLRSNPSKYAFIPSFLSYEQQLEMLENKIETTDITWAWKRIDRTRGECVIL